MTANPTAESIARQITEAFPWDTAPRFLLRDRDASYGQTFRDRVQAMAIEEVVTEIAATNVTERGETRADDRVSEAAMEDRKRDGYF